MKSNVELIEKLREIITVKDEFYFEILIEQLQDEAFLKGFNKCKKEIENVFDNLD